MAAVFEQWLPCAAVILIDRFVAVEVQGVHKFAAGFVAPQSERNAAGTAIK
jgi:hypothetical protein